MAGRKGLTEAPQVGPDLSAPAPAAIVTAEAAMHERAQAVLVEFGDGLPWHVDHYETAIRRELRTGCEAFLRAGRLLVVARECAAHGEWAGMLDRLGLQPRQAQRMIEAARRIAGLPNASTSTHLIAAAGTQSKLIELLSLPEEEFAELAADGETHGLTVDDVERMTTQELRAAIRNARADIEAKDDRAGQRERVVEQLQKQVRQLKREATKATPDEVAMELRTACQSAALSVRAELSVAAEGAGSLRNRIAALMEHGAEHDQEHREFCAGLISELLTEIRRVRDEFALPITNDAEAIA